MRVSIGREIPPAQVSRFVPALVLFVLVLLSPASARSQSAVGSPNDIAQDESTRDAGATRANQEAAPQSDAVPPGTLPEATAPTLATAEKIEDQGATEVAEEGSKDEGDAVAANFLTRCAGCHTIGGGAMKGPDLAPATQWSAQDLAVSIRKMKKNAGPIDETEVASLASLLSDPKLRDRLDAERQRSVAQMAASLDAPNPAIGSALFFGSKRLTNGGMACASCHRIGAAGGELGPDLTELKDRLPRVAMLSAIEGANFAIMRPAYTEHPVTKQEAIHLTGFFEDLNVPVASAGDAAWLVPISSGTALLLVLMIGIVFKNRGPAGIRARLVRDAQREVS